MELDLVPALKVFTVQINQWHRVLMMEDEHNRAEGRLYRAPEGGYTEDISK